MKSQLYGCRIELQTKSPFEKVRPPQILGPIAACDALLVVPRDPFQTGSKDNSFCDQDRQAAREGVLDGDRMPETSASVIETADGKMHSQQQIPMIPFARLWLTGLATVLLLGIEGAFAICPCGDGICGGATCIPPETSSSCPADCGQTPPPPTELSVSVTVVPFGDPGLFNLHVDNTTIATDVPYASSIGPRALTPGAHTLSVTAGAGTNLANYSTTIGGSCSAGGNIQPGGTQNCSITNLRLPTPPPAPGCATVCVTEFFQCGASGESTEFCRRTFDLCRNRCQIGPARRLSIARYRRPNMPSANLDETAADSILALMSNILRTPDGSDDIDCNVAFSRDGHIGEYAIGDGIIDTQNEMDDVFAVPGNIKVARAIDFCEGHFDPLFAGCARRPGETLIVERPVGGSFLLEGVIWAHEYGHNRGLDHPDPNDPNAVMNEFATEDSVRVNLRECMAYHQGASLDAVDVSTPGSASAAAATKGTTPLTDIRDFVRRTFIHGTPYDEIMRYDPSVVPTLLEMLRNPQEAQAWPNIVVVLGLLGDDRAVTSLISFIGETKGELDYLRYKAIRNAFFGLGYLVARGGNERALAYLKGGLDPSAWVERGITWSSPDRETVTERNHELSRMAIIGLGVSGDPSAEEALRSLLTPAPTAIEREFREKMSGVILEALKANQRIAKEGLARYYRKSTP
jgi:hypothetical protein